MTTTAASTVTLTCGRCSGSGIHCGGTCYGCAGIGTVTITARAAKARRTRAANEKAAYTASVNRIHQDRAGWTVEDYIAANDAEVAAGRAFAGDPAAVRVWAEAQRAARLAAIGV